MHASGTLSTPRESAQSIQRNECERLSPIAVLHEDEPHSTAQNRAKWTVQISSEDATVQEVRSVDDSLGSQE